MATDDLQFDRAESTTPEHPALACSTCKQPIVSEYYTANGAAVCAPCRGQLERELRSTENRLPTAILFGIGAAIVGAILYFAVAAISGLEIGIVAIAVGWLVGRAMQKATGGRGGPIHQLIAVVLTYLSVAAAYFGLMVRAIGDSVRPGLAFAIGLPLTVAFQNMPGGLISLLILFVGLAQAWRMTAKLSINVLGPFQVRPADPEPNT